jgi:plasmid stabilization system protein ParE
MRLRLHPAALAELDEAVAWHEERRTGWGSVLFEELSLRIGQAARFPRSGAPVMGFESKYDVRQYVLSRFKYVVITAHVSGEQVVVAVAHTSRQPKYWRRRLTEPHPR